MSRCADATLPGLTLTASGFGLDALFNLKSARGHFPALPLSITMPSPGPIRPSTQAPPIEAAAPVVAGDDPIALNVAQPAFADLPSAEQDRVLVQAALRGDHAAFAELVSRYQAAVYNTAYRMLGNPTDAEDATQEIFLKAWNQLHTFQMERRFSTWLLSIASHHAIDMLRRRKPSAPLDGVALFVESSEPAPIETVIRNEQSEAVRQLLDTLPDKYRAVTVLRYYNDLSYDEIAEATGLTESAVKTQLHRARRMLADKLLQDEQDTAPGETTRTPDKEAR